MRTLDLILAGALLAGCMTEPGEVPSPVIDRASVAEGPSNVLSAVVTVQARFADSVVVRFGTTAAALDSVAPAAFAQGDSFYIPVLGLLPGTDYLFRPVARGSTGVAESELLHLTTGMLPADLPHYAAGGTDPSPGYVVFAAAGYGIVIDNSGRVVWYIRLSGPTLNFQAEPTGRYVTRPSLNPADPAPWVELDPLGNVTRRKGCLRGLVPRFHDLIDEPDGSYWIMCDERRVMDLSAAGGVVDAEVTGTVIQHVSAGGTLLFEWSPFDHFEITDLAPASRGGPSVNWTHGNALDLDADRNLLVSFRSLNEITKIDTHTGAVLWRMGGLRNQFAFPDGEPPFVGQHGLRSTGPGQLVVLDNLGEAGGSRAERYDLDAASRTARRIGAYGSSPSVRALLGGTTQDLPGGRTLVAFGNGGRVEEYDRSGAVVWRILGDPGYVFRAQRIRSLYLPGVGLPR